jgi:phosphatidylserine decarboxylase
MIKNLTENKRLIVQMISKTHGNILQIIIGATNVGSIHLTAEIGKEYKKGDELGYFSFGGSMIITLFQAKSVEINNQFTLHTQNLTEVLLKMGTSLSCCE